MVISYADIVINEIFTDAIGSDTGNEWIEIYNNGVSAVNMTGWEIDCDIAPYYTFPTFTLQSSAFVVIHLRSDGTDTQEDLYTSSAWSSSNMSNSSGQVALYNSDSHTQANLIDYVEWGATGQTHESQAINAGQWPATPDFAPAVSEGRSIEYDGSGNSGADWFDQSNPTQGADNSLPVFLTSFSALIIKNAIAIRWTTASEVDNYGYYIYRKRSTEIDFKQISSLIPGAGNSSFPRDYEYIDADVDIGKTYYYQLEDIDFGGNRTRHPAISIKYINDTDSKISPNTFSLSYPYPNPFGNAIGFSSSFLKMTIPATRKNSLVAISVFNILGQEIYSFPNRIFQPGEYIFVLHESQLTSSGTYFWYVRMGSFQEFRKVVLIKR